MPSFKTHAIIGAIAGLGTYIAYKSVQRDEDDSEPFDWLTAACCAGIGVAIASLPDVLEPATSPNHRGFFHSIFVLFLIGLCLTGISAKCAIRLLLYVSGAAYLSHLLADFRTTKCLPWI